MPAPVSHRKPPSRSSPIRIALTLVATLVVVAMVYTMNSFFVEASTVGKGKPSTGRQAEPGLAVGKMESDNKPWVSKVGSAACMCLKPDLEQQRVHLEERFRSVHPWLTQATSAGGGAGNEAAANAEPYDEKFAPVLRVALPGSNSDVPITARVTHEDVSWINKDDVPSGSDSDTHVVEFNYFASSHCNSHHQRPSGAYDLCYRVIHIRGASDGKPLKSSTLQENLDKRVLGSANPCPDPPRTVVKSTTTTKEAAKPSAGLITLQKVLDTCTCDHPYFPVLVDMADAESTAVLQGVPGSSVDRVKNFYLVAENRQDAQLNQLFTETASNGGRSTGRTLLARINERSRGSQTIRNPKPRAAVNCDLHNNLRNIAKVIDTKLPLIGQFRLLTLNSGALLVCYTHNDQVCNGVASSGTWEIAVLSILDPALSFTRTEVDTAYRILAAMAANSDTIDSSAPSPALNHPDQNDHNRWRDDGVELFDIGGNVGAMAYHFWKNGYNVRTFDALPFNVQLLRMSHGFNLIREKAVWAAKPGKENTEPYIGDIQVTHVGLSDQSKGIVCGMFSEKANFGDIQVHCDEKARKPMIMGTYYNRGVMHMRTFDDVLAGDGTKEGEEKPFSHKNPFADLLPESIKQLSDDRKVPEKFLKAINHQRDAALVVEVPRNAVPQEIRDRVFGGRSMAQKHVEFSDQVSKSSGRKFVDRGLISGVVQSTGSGVAKVELKRRTRLPVTTAWLKSLLQDKQYIVKIDIEGHELEAMKGATKFLDDYHPKLIISEIWNRMNISEYGEVMVGRHGYYMYFIDRHMWLEDTNAVTQWWLSTTPKTKFTLDNVIFVKPEYAHVIKGAVNKHISSELMDAAVEVIRMASQG